MLWIGCQTKATCPLCDFRAHTSRSVAGEGDATHAESTRRRSRRCGAIRCSRSPSMTSPRALVTSAHNEHHRVALRDGVAPAGCHERRRVTQPGADAGPRSCSRWQERWRKTKWAELLPLVPAGVRFLGGVQEDTNKRGCGENKEHAPGSRGNPQH